MFLQKGYTVSDFLVPFALDGHLEWFIQNETAQVFRSEWPTKEVSLPRLNRSLSIFLRLFYYRSRFCIEMIYILHYDIIYELFRNEIKWKLACSVHSLWMIHRRRTVQIGLKLGGVDRTRQSRQLHIQKRRRLRTWANKYHPRALSYCAIQIIIIIAVKCDRYGNYFLVLLFVGKFINWHSSNNYYISTCN